MANGPTRARRPTYWWWFLSGFLGLFGGLIAWIFNNEDHRYEANAMLMAGMASTVGYVVLFVLSTSGEALP
jgi:uncharacterized membrane protein YhaH (DUF805 family)